MKENLLRFKQRREHYNKALTLLINQSQKTEFDDEGIAAMMHFFEMTFELGWKMLKDYLNEEGFDIKSPRSAIKRAFETGYIDDGHLWLEMLEARNKVAHTYDEGVARDLLKKILEKYLKPLTKLGSDAASLD